MFKTYALSIWAVLTLAMATIANANPLVYGKWASVQDMGGMKYTLALDIQESKSSLSVTCGMNDKSVTAKVTVPTRVTDNQLVITGTASDSKKLGDIDCTVEVVPMEFGYKLDGNDKLLLTAQGQTVPFDRTK